MRERKSHIALFHTLRHKEKSRVDYGTESLAEDIFEALRIDGYYIYQLILCDNTYVMPVESLIEMDVDFGKIRRTRKTWFGLSSKNTDDILVFPRTGFYYPYEWGTYTYIYTKNRYSTEQIDIWLKEQFPKHWVDLDCTHAGFNSETLKLIDSSDYLIVTNHDYQTEFGITGNKDTIGKLKSKFRGLDLDKYEEIKY